MVEFMLCLNLTVHRCTAVQILPYKFKKIYSWAFSTYLDHFSERS